jgi:hypothetical protein
MCPGPLRVFRGKQARDQIARDHEKHVDSDEAALETGHVQVVEDDEYHRDSAQSLDVGTKANHAVEVRFELSRRDHTALTRNI